jgi:hypothetical protein
MLVAWQSLKKYGFGGCHNVPDGYNGSFYMFWNNYESSFAIFRFDSDTQACTTFCPMQVQLHMHLSHLVRVVSGHTSGCKLFYLFTTDELWVLSFPVDGDGTKFTLTRVLTNWNTFSIVSAVEYLGGVVMVTVSGGCFFYHPTVNKLMILSSLPPTSAASKEIAAFNGCLLALVEQHTVPNVFKLTPTWEPIVCKLTLTWENILQISNFNATCPSWEKIQHTSLATAWIPRSAKYYIADSSLVFSSQQPIISTKHYSRIKDKPSRPTNITRLDHPYQLTCL